MKNFIDIKDLSKSELISLLDNAIQNKRSKTTIQNYLNGKNLVLFFEKKSTRTRLSFDIAIKQLGGFTTILNKEDIHLGNDKESVSDTINTFGLYADGLILRVNDHKTIMSASKLSNLPVINALSNLSHPCQCLAGLMTLLEERGSLKKLNLVWMGPITNVANSWIEAFKKDLGFSLNIFCPEAWFEKFKEKMQEYDISTDFDDIVHHYINDKILAHADAVMTDTWKSMGDKNPLSEEVFKPFQVNNNIMKAAHESAIFMHCLPAYRNKEVVSEVLEGNQSVVFDEAENRLHAQKAIMHFCIN